MGNTLQLKRMADLAVKMPGYVSHKPFVAEDGERLTLFEWESLETLRACALGRPIPSTSLSKRPDDRSSMRTIVFRSARSRASRRSCGAPNRVPGRAAPPERSGGHDVRARRAASPV